MNSQSTQKCTRERVWIPLEYCKCAEPAASDVRRSTSLSTNKQVILYLMIDQMKEKN